MRIVLLVFAVCEGLLAWGLGALGIRLLWAIRPGMERSDSNETFAIGMLVGVGALVLLLAAAVFGGLCAASGIVVRRVARRNCWKALDITVFVVGASCTSLAIVAVLWRLALT
ncbi:MAG TPA: hypothetical protein VGK67_17245 [Myxococcales bacterium]|jgi:hypothetical protein